MNFMWGRPGFYQDITGPRSSSVQPFDSPPIHVIDDDSESNRRQPEGGSSSSSNSVPREHMFDKVVTPSDVGKLNRLVIPKQHAEKYFPLDSSTNEKGLLLNFEDRNGKPWRFRYSYWNSSQSYVMTKGWSRFVKEKRLDAGDIVSFQRGVGELGKDRLFIDWRRRPNAPEIQSPFYSFSISNHHQFHGLHRPIHPWSPLFLPSNSNQNHHHRAAAAAAYGGYGVMNGNPCPMGMGSIFYLRSGGGGGGGYVSGAGVGSQGQRGVEPMVLESVPAVHGKAAAKRLRLFGVNVDCPISESDDYDMMSSSTSPTTATLPLLHHFPATNFDSSPSSSSVPSDIQLKFGYGYSGGDDKGKGSMSLDLDI